MRHRARLLNTVHFDKYQFDLPDGWTTTGRFPLLTVFKSDGVGTLTFLSFTPETPHPPSHWQDFKGKLAGKVSTTQDKKTFSKTWAFFHADGTCLRVNYRCHPSHASIEHLELDQILTSLREVSGSSAQDRP